MSAWRSGAESRPAWLQSSSTSVSGARFCVCTIKILGMRIGVENGFGKSGKQRIEDKASKTSRAGSRLDSW